MGLNNAENATVICSYIKPNILLRTIITLVFLASGVSSQAEYEPNASYSFSPNVQLLDAGFNNGSFYYGMQQGGAPLFIGVALSPPPEPWRLMCQQVTQPFNGDVLMVPRYTKDTCFLPIKIDYEGAAIPLVDPVVIAEGDGFNYPPPPAPPLPPLEINQIQINARIDRLQTMGPYNGQVAVWLEVGTGMPERYDLPPIQYSVTQNSYFTASLDGVMGFGSQVKGVVVSQSTPRIHVETNRPVLLNADMSPLSRDAESITTANLSLALSSTSNDAQQAVIDRSFGDVNESVNLQNSGAYDFYLAGKISINTNNPAGSYTGTLTVSCVPF